jgi:hypothetical protein
MNILDISPAFNGLEQPFQLLIVTNTINQGIPVPSKVSYNLFGVIQPLNERKLKITPIEEREFGTHMIHIRQTLLKQNNIILNVATNYFAIKQNYTYKVIGKWIYNDYGYAQADAIQTVK